MKQEITTNQALMALYTASQKALLTRSEHDFLLECAKVLETFITPKPVEEKKK